MKEDTVDKHENRLWCITVWHEEGKEMDLIVCAKTLDDAISKTRSWIIGAHQYGYEICDVNCHRVDVIDVAFRKAGEE